MVDQEVVDILAEIKHRIASTQQPTSAPGSNVEPSESLPVGQLSTNVSDYPSLVVLARAWDRLPPVVTNRTGTVASLELWLKRKLQRALRWITWEQVNFNAATHQTFLELIQSLNATQRQLNTMDQRLLSLSEKLKNNREELESNREELRNGNKELRSELLTHHAQFDQLRGEIARHQAEVNNRRAELEASLEARLENQQAAINARLDEIATVSIEQNSAELRQRLNELLIELRERDERLLDEQRVCFKQLSLELTESQVLQDRARRELDTRVTKLETGTTE